MERSTAAVMAMILAAAGCAAQRESQPWLQTPQAQQMRNGTELVEEAEHWRDKLNRRLGGYRRNVDGTGAGAAGTR